MFATITTQPHGREKTLTILNVEQLSKLEQYTPGIPPTKHQKIVMTLPRHLLGFDLEVDTNIPS